MPENWLAAVDQLRTVPELRVIVLNFARARKRHLEA